ncbi:MLX-interacting protein-like isoform X2 [Saccostrea echinata]|uniref:MLX-interacting protein-like isoform X2 n=1 Tax=Saccostrea echinata TaxID=191078 RepID=UPI002A835AE9|nr:MLX-interacting protein-like isoform X2 [Saccostrea echinata]
MMAIEKTSTSSSQATTLKNCKMEESAQHEQPIHSGHFMITNVHGKYQDDEEDDDEDVKPQLEETGYDFNTANKTPSNSYPFGPNATLSIDDSLTKLFDCMSLAYSGKLTSPKWKAFRGLHLTVKDKVRLNNIIWREWCMQYIYGKKPTVCQFASPLSDDIHTKPEAIVLEGKYWKRRLDTVTKEYKSWRKFSKSQLAKNFSSDMKASNTELLSRVGEVLTIPNNQQMSATDLLLNSTDFMDIDFSSDSLFNNLNHPFAFPNPKEFYGMSTADLMQPGLVPLQPNLDDLMDYDPIQDIVTTRSQGNNVMYFTGNQNMDTTTSNSNTIDTRQVQTQSPGIELQPQSPGNKTLGDLLSGLLGSINSASFTDVNSPESQLLIKLQQQQQQQSGAQTQQNTSNTLFFLPQNNEETSINSVPSVPTVSHSPSEPAIPKISSLEEALLSKNPVLRNQNTKSPATPPSRPPTKSKSAPQVSKKSTQKKEGNFVKPNKPATRPKQRMIAPTPAPSANNTYLAQLLTTGTYPGAIINVKKEAGGVATPSLVTIQGQQPTPTPLVVSSIPYKLTDASILLQTQSPGVEATKDTLINFVSNPVKLSTNTSTTVSKISSVPTLTPTKTALPSLSSHLSETLSPRRASYPPSSTTTVLSNPTSPSESLSVTSPSGNYSGDSDAEFRGGEHRRLNHTSAEQKRRCNIKSGFDLLHTLIPTLSQNPNAKVSKAAMLQKTAEYCKKLKAERAQMQNEAEILRQEIESLNVQISQCQAQLPATGVPVTRQRVDQMKEMFQEYVKNRTLTNWKFWIFSTIIQGLFDTYNNMVSTASVDELCRTTLAWLDQHCSLVVLRPAVLNALRQLSTTTCILSDPSRMPEHATEAVLKTDKSTDT